MLEHCQSWFFTSFHNVVIAYVGGKKTGGHDALKSKKGKPTKKIFLDTCPITFLLSISNSQLGLCYKHRFKFFFFSASVSLECIYCLCKS